MPKLMEKYKISAKLDDQSKIPCVIDCGARLYINAWYLLQNGSEATVLENEPTYTLKQYREFVEEMIGIYKMQEDVDFIVWKEYAHPVNGEKQQEFAFRFDLAFLIANNRSEGLLAEDIINILQNHIKAEIPSSHMGL